MDDANYGALKSEFLSNAALLKFWSWLKPGYNAFKNTKTLPNIGISETGKYFVN